MVSRRTRVASWILRRDQPSRPKAMICCFFSSFKTFAMLREATYSPAAVNVPDVSSESMAAFQVFLYGRFWVFTEGQTYPVRHSGLWIRFFRVCVRLWQGYTSMPWPPRALASPNRCRSMGLIIEVHNA